MQHTLQVLLERNPFASLDIPPSTPAAELRRVLSEVRIEASIGLRTVSEADLAAAEQMLLRDAGSFEMRLFVPWADDPLLGPLAPLHDQALASLWYTTPEIDALELWVRLFALPGLADALESLKPAELGLPRLWGEIAVEIAKQGLRAGWAKPNEYLHHVLPVEQVDPAPLARMAQEWVISTMDDVDREARGALNSRGAITREAGESVLHQALEAFEDAKWTQDLFLGDARWEGRQWEEAASQLAERVKQSSYLIGTALHNGGFYAQAEELVTRALQLHHSVSDREEMEADLRIIRLVASRESFAAAMQRRDFAAAVAALGRTIENSDDEAERVQARALIVRLKAAQERANRSPLRKAWDWGKGWAIGVAVTGGIVAGVALLGSGDEDSSDNSSSGSSGGSSPGYSFLEPKVGDCISTLGTTSVSVRVVSCANRNDGRVVATGRLEGTSYPSAASLDRQASVICPAYSDSYIYPAPDGWAAGERQVLCIDE